MSKKKRLLSGILRRSASLLLVVAMIITGVTLPEIDWQKSEAATYNNASPYEWTVNLADTSKIVKYSWEPTVEDSHLVSSSNITTTYNVLKNSLDIVNTTGQGVEMEKLDTSGTVTSPYGGTIYKNGAWNTSVAGLGSWTSTSFNTATLESSDEGLIMPVASALNWEPPAYSSSDSTRYAYFLVKYDAEGYVPRMRVWSFDETHGRTTDETHIPYRNHASSIWTAQTVEDQVVYAEKEFHQADGNVQYQLLWVELTNYKYTSASGKSQIDYIAFEVNGVDAEETGLYHELNENLESKRAAVAGQTISLYGIWGFDSELDALAYMYSDIKENEDERYTHVINAPQKVALGDTYTSVINDILPQTESYRTILNPGKTISYNDPTFVSELYRTVADVSVKTPLGLTNYRPAGNSLGFSESINKQIEAGTGHFISGNQGYLEIAKMTAGESVGVGSYQFGLVYDWHRSGYGGTTGSGIYIKSPIEVVAAGNDPSLSTETYKSEISNTALGFHQARLLDMDFVYMDPQYDKLGTEDSKDLFYDGQEGYMKDTLSINNYVSYAHAISATDGSNRTPEQEDSTNVVSGRIHTSTGNMTYDLGPEISNIYEKIVFYYTNTENTPIDIEFIKDGVVVEKKEAANPSGYVYFDIAMDQGFEATEENNYAIRVIGCDDDKETALDINKIELLCPHTVKVSFNNELDREDHEAWNFNNKAMGVYCGGYLVDEAFVNEHSEFASIETNATNNGYVYTISGINCNNGTQIEVFAVQQSDYNFAYNITTAEAETLDGKDVANELSVQNGLNHVNYKFTVKADTKIDVTVAWVDYSTVISGGMGLINKDGTVDVVENPDAVETDDVEIPDPTPAPSFSIAGDKTEFTPAENITVNYENAIGDVAGTHDRIEIYPASHTLGETEPLQTQNVDGTGSVIFNALPVGNYRIYMFNDSTFTEIKHINITVKEAESGTDPEPTVAPSFNVGTEFEAEAAISVTYTNAVDDTEGSYDKIAIYPASHTLGTTEPLQYAYVDGNGTVVFNDPANGSTTDDNTVNKVFFAGDEATVLPAGSYRIYMFNDSTLTAIKYIDITVKEAAPEPEPTVEFASHFDSIELTDNGHIMAGASFNMKGWVVSTNTVSNIDISYDGGSTWTTLSLDRVNVQPEGWNANPQGCFGGDVAVPVAPGTYNIQLRATDSTSGKTNVFKTISNVTVVAAPANGSTTTLTADTIVKGVAFASDATLDLNGHKASGAVTVSGGTFTLKDSSSSKAGVFEATATDADPDGITVKNGSNLVVDGVTVKADFDAIYIESGNATVSNATITGGVAGIHAKNSSTVTITDSTINGGSKSTYAALKAQDTATFTLDGETVINGDCVVNNNTTLRNAFLAADGYEIAFTNTGAHANSTSYTKGTAVVSEEVGIVIPIVQENGYYIGTNKETYYDNEPVNVFIASRDGSDCVTIINNKTGDVVKSFTRSATGDVTVTDNSFVISLPTGEYTACIYAGGGKTGNFTDDELKASAKITVVADPKEEAGAYITVFENYYPVVGEAVYVYAESENASGNDWVGIYKNETSAPFDSYKLSDKSGPVNMLEEFGSLAAGGYTLILFSGEGTSTVLTQVAIAVQTATSVEPPFAASYDIADPTSGFAQGTVKIWIETGIASPGRADNIALYWGKNETEKLDGYDALGVYPMYSSGYKEIQIDNYTTIPEGAKTLLVYGYTGNYSTPLAITLPDGCQFTTAGSTLSTKFNIVSDTHVMADTASTDGNEHVEEEYYTKINENVISMFNDINNYVGGSSAIGIAGDVVDWYGQDYYTKFYSIYNQYGGGIPMYWSIGNHEKLKNGNWDIFMGQDGSNLGNVPSGSKPYYDWWVADGKVHLVSLGSEARTYTEQAVISEEQVAWFYGIVKAHMAEHPNEPLFVMLHQPIYNTIAGGLKLDNGKNQNWDGVADTSAQADDGTTKGKFHASEINLMKILASCPNAMIFSGHSHWEMASDGTMYKADEYMGNAFNTGAVGYLWTDWPYNADGSGSDAQKEGYAFVVNNSPRTGSQGYYIEVYNDMVLVRGRNFDTHEWVSAAQFCVKLESNSTPVDTNYATIYVPGNTSANIEAQVDITVTQGNSIPINYNGGNTEKNQWIGIFSEGAGTSTQYAYINADGQVVFNSNVVTADTPEKNKPIATDTKTTSLPVGTYYAVVLGDTVDGGPASALTKYGIYSNVIKITVVASARSGSYSAQTMSVSEEETITKSAMKAVSTTASTDVVLGDLWDFSILYGSTIDVSISDTYEYFQESTHLNTAWYAIYTNADFAKSTASDTAGTYVTAEKLAALTPLDGVACHKVSDGGCTFNTANYPNEDLRIAVYYTDYDNPTDGKHYLLGWCYIKIQKTESMLDVVQSYQDVYRVQYSLNNWCNPKFYINTDIVKPDANSAIRVIYKDVQRDDGSGVSLDDFSNDTNGYLWVNFDGVTDDYGGTAAYDITSDTITFGADYPNDPRYNKSYLDCIVVVYSKTGVVGEDGKTWYKVIGIDEFRIEDIDGENNGYPTKQFDTVSIDKSSYNLGEKVQITGATTDVNYEIYEIHHFAVAGTNSGDWVLDHQYSTAVELDENGAFDISAHNLKPGKYALVAVDDWYYTGGVGANACHYKTLEDHVIFYVTAPAEELIPYPSFPAYKPDTESIPSHKVITSDYGEVYIKFGDRDNTADASSVYGATQTFYAKATNPEYRFVGWFELRTKDSADAKYTVRNLITTDSVYEVKNLYSQNDTLYALFVKANETDIVNYVNFNNDSGETFLKMPVVGTEGYVDYEDLEFNVPVKVGYTFSGWNIPAFNAGKATYFADVECTTATTATAEDAAYALIKGTGYSVVYKKVTGEDGNVTWTAARIINVDRDIDLRAKWKPASTSGKLATFTIEASNMYNSDGSKAADFEKTDATLKTRVTLTTAPSYTADGVKYSLIGWINREQSLKQNYAITGPSVVIYGHGENDVAFANGAVRINGDYYQIMSYLYSFTFWATGKMDIIPVYAAEANYTALMAEAAPAVTMSKYVQYQAVTASKVKMSFNAMLSLESDTTGFEIVEFGYLLYLDKTAAGEPTTTFYDKDGKGEAFKFLSLDTKTDDNGAFKKLVIPEDQINNNAGQYYGSLTTVTTNDQLYVRPYVIYKEKNSTVDTANWTIGYGNTIVIDIDNTTGEVVGDELLWEDEYELVPGSYVNYGATASN